MSTDSTSAHTVSTPRTFVFIGPIELSKGIGVVLREVDDSDNFISEPRYYAMKKELKHRTIGAVYRINADDHTISLNGIQYVRMHSDREFVRQARVAGDVVEMKQRIAKLEHDAKAHDAIAEALEPIRAIYVKTDTLGKRCIEALVLQALRKV